MKKIGYVLIILSVVILVVGTTYKVRKNHNTNLMKVSEKRIIEAAQRCQNEDVCLDNKITLEFLYTKGYLKEEINPLTKEIYNYNSYVLKNLDNYEFIVVN